MPYTPSRLNTRQQGAVLLAFMLVLIMGSSYMLVKSVNENLREHQASQHNAEVLESAKSALLSFAVSFPDYPDLDGGPGYLPCPDLNNNGSPAGSCSLDGGTLVGRFPDRYERLGVPELRDASGERLWYVVSDTFRYGNGKTVPMNSDEPVGTLTVDNTDDIVAIIIAPGPPLENQDWRNTFDGQITSSNYLDGINADGDENYTRRGGDDFNDQLVYINRRELMSLVEKRVLGELAQRFNDYRQAEVHETNWNLEKAYPWLSEFTNPLESSYKQQVGMYGGHVPYHWSEETSSEDTEYGRNPFDSGFSADWDIANGTISTESGNPPPPPEECVRSNECDDPVFGIMSEPIVVDVADGLCVWETTTDADGELVPYHEYASCQGSRLLSGATTNDHMVFGVGPYPIPYIVYRTYIFEFQYRSTEGENIIASTDSTIRARGVASNDGQIETLVIYVQDEHDLDPSFDALRPFLFPPAEDYEGTSSRELTFSVPPDEPVPGDECAFNPSVSCIAGTLNVEGIHYALDVDLGELPDWFVENEWKHIVYIAYPETEPLPGSDDPDNDCVPGDTCIIVENDTLPNDDIRAITLIAGASVNDPDIGIEQARPSSDLGDYFEYDNADANANIFRSNRWNPAFPGINDQARVMLRVEQ